MRRLMDTGAHCQEEGGEAKKFGRNNPMKYNKKLIDKAGNQIYLTKNYFVKSQQIICH